MKLTKLHNNQSGLVSIIVALTFIIIISLITTSFAFLSRRESRQVLDRQLSTQAFYAAESGVNDAIAKIENSAVNTTECDQADDVSPSGATPALSADFSYTCVLVNEKPTDLQFSDVSTDKSTIVRVQASDGNINSLRFSWEAACTLPQCNPNQFANNDQHYLPQQSFSTNNPGSYTNHTGILRTDIIPVTTGMSRNTLIANTQSLFLYPRGSATANQRGNYPVGSSSKGAFVNGQCNAVNLPRKCNVDVTGLASVGNTPTFYVRLKSIYKPVNATIQAYDVNGRRLTLVNGQAVIDSTGKARDVLRRIQVRVPVLTEYNYPEDALETTADICKLISINGVNGAITDSCNY